MRIKKNGAIISVIVLLLCVAIYLNWSYDRGNPSEAEAVNSESESAGSSIQMLSSDSARFEENDWVIDTAADGSDDERYAELTAYMDGMRLEMEASRDSELTVLQNTIADESATAEMKQSAQLSMAAIASNAVKESQIESLVIAKGFIDCVAIISDAGVSVIVVPEQAGLLSSDVAKITDIVITETGCSAKDIRVVESQR